MILLLANYLNNIEYFSAGETPEAQNTSVTPDEKKITLTLNDNDNKITSNIVWFYVFICLCAYKPILESTILYPPISNANKFPILYCFGITILLSSISILKPFFFINSTNSFISYGL